MWVIEPCHSFCQNSGYLFKKNTTEKYWLVNIAVKLNGLTVRDGNLSSSTNEFPKKFASYAIFLL